MTFTILAMAESTNSSNVATNSLPVKYGRANEEIEAKSNPHKLPRYHSRETHGLNHYIDENTSMDDVRAPNVFERAKKEFQAIAQVFHH